MGPATGRAVKEAVFHGRRQELASCNVILLAGRLLQLIRAFQQDGYRMVYGSPAEASPHASDLAALDIEAVALALNCTRADIKILNISGR
ncbi:MAG: hypothetical protein CMK89_13545 [Pseudomonadales bacterium]|nr:hypothetical protein [Pseudomonadales bacterium]